VALCGVDGAHVGGKWRGLEDCLKQLEACVKHHWAHQQKLVGAGWGAAESGRFGFNFWGWSASGVTPS
jgi:hypothetical protein